MSASMTDVGLALTGPQSEELPPREPEPAPVPEPGMYENMSFEDYKRIPLISASGLELMRRSPLQYFHSLTAERKRTSALDRGTALHLAILEPAVFEHFFRVAGPCVELLKSGDRKGLPCGVAGSYLHERMGWLCGKHIKGAGSGIVSGIEIISAKNYADVIGMRDATMAHKRARSLFEGKGAFETVIIFDDEETGVRVKSRLDRIVQRAGMLVDIKSCRDAQAWAFGKQAESLGYWRRLSAYRRALRAIGWPYKQTAVLAIESEAPYDLVPYLLDEKGLDAADTEVTRLLRVYKNCLADNAWPGYATEFAVLERAAWATGEAA